MTWAMPKAKAPSVPGRGCRWMSASDSTVGVMRGSTTMNLVPLSLARSRLPKRYAIDHAGLSDQIKQLFDASVGSAPTERSPNTMAAPICAAIMQQELSFELVGVPKRFAKRLMAPRGSLGSPQYSMTDSAPYFSLASSMCCAMVS